MFPKNKAENSVLSAIMGRDIESSRTNSLNHPDKKELRNDVKKKNPKQSPDDRSQRKRRQDK